MSRKTLAIITIIAIIFLLVVFFFYVLNFSNGLSKENADWGDFGSYIGGIAGVFLSFLSVLLIIISLDYQYRNSRITQFETSFFELFRLHHEITDRIVGKVAMASNNGIKNEFTGFQYFEKLSEKISHDLIHMFNSVKNSKQEMEEEINLCFDQKLKDEQPVLGHYYRSLYHLINFVDKSKIANSKHYVDLIQAYLSDAQLHCIFYNGISNYGNRNFLPLLEKYLFLENIKSKGGEFEKQFETFYPKTFSAYRRKYNKR